MQWFWKFLPFFFSFFWVARLRHLERDDLEVPKEGLKGGRTEEFTAIFEDFGLRNDEAIADYFEKLSLHGENVVVIEDIGYLSPVLVGHGGVVDELVG